MTEPQADQTIEQIGGVFVTFVRATGAEFDVTAGQLVTAIQADEQVEPGTRVRIAHQEDAGAWFEVLTVLEVREKSQAVA